MKTLIAIITLIAVGGGGTLLLRGGDESGPAADQMLFTVLRGDLTVTITENGSLMAKNSEKITTQTRRGGKITFLAEEGKTVAEGEVLCRLDTTDLEERIEELGLETLKTQADLDTAGTDLEIQKTDNVAAEQKAAIALTKAEMEFEKYREGDAPKERRKLEVAIKTAENEFTVAKKKHEDSAKLLEQDYITQSVLDQDRVAHERAVIDLEGAKRDLEIFDQYTLPMAMTDKQAAVDDARRGVDNAAKRSKSNLRQKEVAVEGYESRLNRVKRKLEEYNEEVGRFTIKSSAPGIVIYGDPSQPWYGIDIKIGSEIWGGLTLFTIPDLRVMQVQVQVHEADISKVAEGQVTTVTMDTYPGLILKGKVARIATLAGAPGGRGSSGEVKKFTVDIVLDSTEGATLKPGISAKAEIFIEKREDVLCVPIQCVFVEEGRHYCYVMGDDGAPRKVRVEPALSNDTYTEIVSGLQEGDRVLLYNPTMEAVDSASAPEGPDASGDAGASDDSEDSDNADDSGAEAGAGDAASAEATAPTTPPTTPPAPAPALEAGSP